MEITRDVVLDLLPLYLADEVSADTRALIDEYLKGDPALANIAKQRAAVELPNSIPIPRSEEGKVDAYRRAKRLWVLGSVVLAIVITALVGALTLAAFLWSRPVIVP
jgi:hypothetical protein